MEVWQWICCGVVAVAVLSGAVALAMQPGPPPPPRAVVYVPIGVQSSMRVSGLDGGSDGRRLSGGSSGWNASHFDHDAEQAFVSCLLSDDGIGEGGAGLGGNEDGTRKASESAVEVR